VSRVRGRRGETIWGANGVEGLIGEGLHGDGVRPMGNDDEGTSPVVLEVDS
jgi:hypothetical protein